MYLKIHTTNQATFVLYLQTLESDDKKMAVTKFSYLNSAIAKYGGI